MCIISVMDDEEQCPVSPSLTNKDVSTEGSVKNMLQNVQNKHQMEFMNFTKREYLDQRKWSVFYFILFWDKERSGFCFRGCYCYDYGIFVADGAVFIFVWGWICYLSRKSLKNMKIRRVFYLHLSGNWFDSNCGSQTFINTLEMFEFNFQEENYQNTEYLHFSFDLKDLHRTNDYFYDIQRD